MVMIRVEKRGGGGPIWYYYEVRNEDGRCCVPRNAELGGIAQHARSRGLSYAGKFIPVAPFPRGGGEVYDVTPGAQQQQR